MVRDRFPMFPFLVLIHLRQVQTVLAMMALFLGQMLPFLELSCQHRIHLVHGQTVHDLIQMFPFLVPKHRLQ
ncbi:hypothetical protein BLA29_015476, partial [Euroglyphus maynei]